MRLSWHIFRKDARYLWKEILLSLVIVAGCVIFYPKTWAPHGVNEPVEQMLLGQRLASVGTTFLILMPLSWFLLIARVVQAESLVGKRHFWLTRPYEWRWLLAAKGIFIAVFVLAPFEASQWLLLVEGGFRPAAYLPGLAFNLLLVVVAMLLPMLALAAMSSNVGWTALWLIGVIAFIGLAALVFQWVGAENIHAPQSDPELYVLALMAACAVVVMYARRWVWLSAGMLACAGVTMAWLAIYFPTPGMVEASYRPVNGVLDAPLEMSLTDTAGFDGDVGKKGKARLYLTVELSGVAAGKAVALDDARLALTGHEGRRLELPWRSVSGDAVRPGAYRKRMNFDIKASDLEWLKKGPVKAEMEMAVTEALGNRSQEFALGKGELAVDGFGVCPTAGLGVTTEEMAQCRFAVNETPQLRYVEVEGANCAGQGETVWEDGWVGGMDSGLGELAFTPVFTGGPMMTFRGDTAQKVCLPAKVRLTEYRPARRVRVIVRGTVTSWQDVTHDYDVRTEMFRKP